MYIHLGQDVSVSKKKIVGIFDMDNTSVSEITKNFLRKAGKENRVVNISEGLPKSFVVVHEDKQTYIYISSISSSTLFKRSNNI